MSERHPSPLRYPGGKTSMADLLIAVIESNGLQGCTYVEPFAGGSGAAIQLLRGGYVDEIHINDADPAIACFWKSILEQPDQFIELIEDTEITVREWHRQKEVYRRGRRAGVLALGFATFFLNRCNRSGIIKNGWPIGGLEQDGPWKIDARFTKATLINRIQVIASYRERIRVTNEDAALLLERLNTNQDRTFFIYADPPYYVKGQELYLNYFEDNHHALLAATIAYAGYHWIVSYDDVPRIRELYSDQLLIPFNQRYSAHQSAVEGAELLIAPLHLTLPQDLRGLLDHRGAGARRTG